MNATEQDLERFFGVAKAHGWSLEQCKGRFLERFGHRLNDTTAEELEEFAQFICFMSRKHEPLPGELE